ncbi:MAG: hypothetical protein Q4B68_02510 [Bacteroidales bacterium]|nr:hypothetical protein [Bacteroidales bacterium]
MKRNKDDMELAELLKKGSHQESENEWFTPRVLNRLPEKRRSSRWMKVVLYAIVLAGVIGCWMWYNSTHDMSVITVRDVLLFATMICSSMAVACVAVIDLVKSE